MYKHKNSDRSFERQERSEQPRMRHDNRHQARENTNRQYEDRPSRVRPDQVPFDTAAYKQELAGALKAFHADSFHDIFSAMAHMQEAFWMARRGGPLVVRDFAQALRDAVSASGGQSAGDSETVDKLISAVTAPHVAAKPPVTPVEAGPKISEVVALATASLPQDKETNEFRHDLIAFDYFYEFSTSDAHKRQHQAIEESIFEAININGSAWLAAAQHTYDFMGRDLAIE
jgi:hypothetical protein